jgi:hypothetical protein
MMKQNVIFLVHLEEMFEIHFPPTLREDARHVADRYDEVIVLSSYVQDEGPIWEIANQKHTEWHWTWGYEPDRCTKCQDDAWRELSGICSCMEREENEWIIPARGHEWTYVPRELRDNLSKLETCNIYVAGGSKYACLQDWLNVLDFMGLDYTLDHYLTYP